MRPLPGCLTGSFVCRMGEYKYESVEDWKYGSNLTRDCTSRLPVFHTSILFTGNPFNLIHPEQMPDPSCQNKKIIAESVQIFNDQGLIQVLFFIKFHNQPLCTAANGSANMSR